MAEGAFRAGRGYSGEQSRSQGGGIGCAEAGTTSGEGWGTPRAKAQARGEAKSARRMHVRWNDEREFTTTR
jgi:hypothetical protein